MFPPLFELVFFSALIGYLLNFTIWFIVFLLYGLSAPVCVVHVGVLKIWMLEFIEGVGDILWNVEVKASCMLIFPF